MLQIHQNAIWSECSRWCVQQKLDEIFGKLTQVMCIADDIMVVGYKDDHSNHDLALTKLFQTAQKNNVKLNLRSFNKRNMKCYSLVRITQHRGENQILKKLKLLWRWNSLRTRKKCRHSWNGSILAKGYITSVSPSRTTEGPHQNKFTLHLGSRIHYCNECNPRRDGMSTHPKVLWSKEENCSTNRCQLQRTWSMSSARWTPNLLCQQIPYRCRKRVCSNWAQSSCCIMACEKFHHFLYGLHFTLQTDQNPWNQSLHDLSLRQLQIAETVDKSKCMWF